MKKLAILTMVLVFALSSVAFAAPSFTGSFDASTKVDLQNYLANAGNYGDNFKLTLSAAEENVWGLDVVLKKADVSSLALDSAALLAATTKEASVAAFSSTTTPVLKLDQYKLSINGGYVGASALKSPGGDDDLALGADLKELFDLIGKDNRKDDGNGRIRVETTQLTQDELGFKAGLQLDGVGGTTLRGEVPFGDSSVGFIANTAGGQGAATKYAGFGTVVVGPATIKAEAGQNTAKENPAYKSGTTALYASAKVANVGMEGLTLEGKVYQDGAQAFNNKKGAYAKATYEVGNIQVVGDAGLTDRLDEQKVIDGGLAVLKAPGKVTVTLDETTAALSTTYRTSATEDEPAFADIFGDAWNTNKGLAMNAKVEYATHGKPEKTDYVLTDSTGTKTAVLADQPKTVITVQGVAPVTESVVVLGRFINTAHKDAYYLFEDRTVPTISGTPKTVVAHGDNTQIYGAVSAKLTEKLTSTTSAENFAVSNNEYSLLTLSETLKYAYTDNASLSFQVARDSEKDGKDAKTVDNTWAKVKLAVSF